ASEKSCTVISKKCIDQEFYEGETFVFPEYVTSFNSAELRFCASHETVVKSKIPAVIFVMDQSGSMKWTNDIDGLRAPSVKQSLERMRNNYPEIAAGFVEFGAYVDWSKGVDDLHKESHYNSLISGIVNKEITGTNYYDALKKSKEYMDDLDSSVYAPYVVFITDGRPSRGGTNDAGNYGEVRDLLNEYPKVYPFFLGDAFDDEKNVPVGDGSYMSTKEITADMAKRTGGDYYHISKENTYAMADTLDKIIEFIVEDVKQGISNIKVDAKGPESQFSVFSSEITADSDSTWKGAFDFAIPLGVGDNSIDLDISYFKTDSKLFSFTVEREEGLDDEEYESDQWDLECELIKRDTIELMDTVTYAPSTLTLLMEEGYGRKGSSEITLVAGNYASKRLTVHAHLEFPEGEEIEMRLERDENGDWGVYTDDKDIQEELEEYQGEDVLLKAWFVDHFGDTITTELEVRVRAEEIIEITEGIQSVDVVRGLIDYREDNEQFDIGDLDRYTQDTEVLDRVYVYRKDGKRVRQLSGENYSESSGEKIREAAIAGPSFVLELEAPDVTGYDAAFTDEPEWKDVTTIEIMYYDHLGQFLNSASHVVSLGDLFAEDDTEELILEWAPILENENLKLVNSKGRQVSTGVIIAVIKSVTHLTLNNDVADLEEGLVQVLTSGVTYRFGYIRPEAM
ncbi:MAG: VWA domain-containing protein, partial [Fibrobacterales bacterium]